MLNIPNMVIIGGNSRNCGKTTMACDVIARLSATHEVIGLKVTSIRPGEADMHGNHADEDTSDYSIIAESDPKSGKDTSKMLMAGASQVFYIRASENFIEKAILHFLSWCINKQIIVCESRSLRGIINPGLFLMMMRISAEGKIKEVSKYLSLADKVFYFGPDSYRDRTDKQKFIDNLQFIKGRFDMM